MTRTALHAALLIALASPAFDARAQNADQAPDEDARVAALIARHLRYGKTPEHAERHVRESDERNAALIATWRDNADLLLAWPSWDR